MSTDTDHDSNKPHSDLKLFGRAITTPRKVTNIPTSRIGSARQTHQQKVKQRDALHDNWETNATQEIATPLFDAEAKVQMVGTSNRFQKLHCSTFIWLLRELRAFWSCANIRETHLMPLLWKTGALEISEKQLPVIFDCQSTKNRRFAEVSPCAVSAASACCSWRLGTEGTYDEHTHTHTNPSWFACTVRTDFITGQDLFFCE